MMISRSILLLFFGCLLLLGLFGLNAGVVGGTSEPLEVFCPNNTAYNSSSSIGRSYRTNLLFLLFTLSSKASQPNGFYNFTAASSNPANATAVAYGLFLCRGDVNPSDCEECVATASSEILQRCPDRNVATIWYDVCMLRYSNQSIFSRLDNSVGLFLVNTQNVTNVTLFNQVLGDTMDQIANKAANDLSGKKFAVQETNFSKLQGRLYALGQCTPDLSRLDCGTCLTTAISNLPLCCTNRRGGRVIFPSCNIRYELYPFNNPVAPPPSSPPPTLPHPPPNPESNKGKPTILLLLLLKVMYAPHMHAACSIYMQYLALYMVN